jgi:hypothetical protein
MGLPTYEQIDAGFRRRDAAVLRQASGILLRRAPRKSSLVLRVLCRVLDRAADRIEQGGSDDG